MQIKIERYIRQWRRQGYQADIPDDCPSELTRLNLAPSYRAIAVAILKNDHAMLSLGFSPDPSPWYMELKRQELQRRNNQPCLQLDFWR